MGKVFETIDERLRSWIGEQQMFFVSTAPMSADGLINCSPKGMDSLRVLGPTSVAYLDMTGSGVETIAHLKENRRIVVMFCAMNGLPKILRLYGQGEVHERGSDRYRELVAHFDEHPAARAIICVDVKRIADSCGFTVPKYAFESQRETMTNWAEKKGPDGVRAYQREHNVLSLDGLPGLSTV